MQAQLDSHRYQRFALRAFCWRNRDQSGSNDEGPVMSDKSPRQTMSKKVGKSLKETRVAKDAKAVLRAASTEASIHDKLPHGKKR
jgi:hypothetical protein